ncbi:MAG: transpeptidase family protein [Ignavibacterium sp.]|nr:MAG: transpeptidase family protein [Ignavibacterium sp.]
MINSRALIVVFVFLFLFAAQVIKLVDVQIVKSEELNYYARMQQTKLETIKADRGLIYDRNNILLVHNRNEASFYLDLRMLHDNKKENLAKKFASVIGKRMSHYLELMNSSGKTICLEKKVPIEKAILLKDIKLPALFSVEKPTRVYQYGSLASHVLGYVDNDYTGANGVAKAFEEELNGEVGSRIVERDAIGRIITVSGEEVTTAIPGDNLVLTIDKTYQTILEEELKKGLQHYRGESATGIMMNPNTGEILALANITDYNPNYYWKFNDFQRKNRAVTDIYEPGSTFKAFTLAALFEEGKCSEGELVNVENGKYKLENIFIRDTHKNRYLTVTGILEESSNIGISKLIQRLDNDTYYKYLRGFGFGSYTSITLPGEVRGILKKPNRWSRISKAFMSFGYEVSVTPLQLITAYSAVVNGGKLYEPHILKRKTDKNGTVIFENSPVLVRQVISDETSNRIRKMLRSAVQNGTGELAEVETIKVGGKTGTTQKLVDGKYSKEKYNVSFVGFFPLDNPQFVCLIIVNSPQKEKYGGKVAAPIFKAIVERTVATDPAKFQKNDYESESTENRFVTSENNIDYDLRVNKIVDLQNTNEDNSKYKYNLMPDLRGRSIKDALISLNMLGLKYDIRGSGIVKTQSINPGIKIKEDQVCKLNCSETTIKGAIIY